MQTNAALIPAQEVTAPPTTISLPTEDGYHFPKKMHNASTIAFLTFPNAKTYQHVTSAMLSFVNPLFPPSPSPPPPHPSVRPLISSRHIASNRRRIVLQPLLFNYPHEVDLCHLRQMDCSTTDLLKP